MSKHTPGPWHNTIRQTGLDHPVRTEDASLICTVNGVEFDFEESKANARLISAAPDLLLIVHAVRADAMSFSGTTGELCFGGFMYSTSGTPEDLSKTLDIIGRDSVNAAIAKAESK